MSCKTNVCRVSSPPHKKLKRHTCTTYTIVCWFGISGNGQGGGVKKSLIKESLNYREKITKEIPSGEIEICLSYINQENHHNLLRISFFCPAFETHCFHGHTYYHSKRSLQCFFVDRIVKSVTQYWKLKQRPLYTLSGLEWHQVMLFSWLI